MTHLSPAIFGMWAVCSVLFAAFCIYHIWHYDRFNCLRIHRGPYSGAFRRFMTYTFLLTLPLIIIYSVGNSVIKYREGFVFTPERGVFPKPYEQWTKAHRDAVFPLRMLLSFSFSFGLITHLEELCFWLFLMNATSSSQDWFKSIYFLIWSCGSVAALVTLPTVTGVFRSDPFRDEAYTFLVGGIGRLILALCFLPVLYLFPAFMRGLVKQGVDKATVARLQKFHELNRLRVVFDLLFAVPLVIFGTDGLKPHLHSINDSMFWTEILGMASAFGCIISSAITLLIFFPRNSMGEYESSSLGRLSRLEESERKVGPEALESGNELYQLEFSSETSIGYLPNPHPYLNYAMDFTPRSQEEGENGEPPGYQSPGARDSDTDHSGDTAVNSLTPLRLSPVSGTLRPNRLGPDGDVELGGVHNPPTTRTWVSNWLSQPRSPLDVLLQSVY